VLDRQLVASPAHAVGDVFRPADRGTDGRSRLAAPSTGAATTTPPPDRCDDRWSSPVLHATTPPAPSYRRCSVQVAALLSAVTSSNVVIGNTAERCRRQRRRMSQTTATVPARPPPGLQPVARPRWCRLGCVSHDAAARPQRRSLIVARSRRRARAPGDSAARRLRCRPGPRQLQSRALLLTSSATSLCVAAAAPLHTAER